MPIPAQELADEATRGNGSPQASIQEAIRLCSSTCNYRRPQRKGVQLNSKVTIIPPGLARTVLRAPPAHQLPLPQDPIHTPYQSQPSSLDPSDGARVLPTCDTVTDHTGATCEENVAITLCICHKRYCHFHLETGGLAHQPTMLRNG